MDMNFNDITTNAKKTRRELLLSFDFKEPDLNQKTGERIIDFLNNLKKNKIRFKLSKPLFMCQLGINYGRIVKEYLIPYNCYECAELFTIENEDIISCKYINKKGPKIYYMEDRNQIWEFFNILRLEKHPSQTCRRCKYFLRKQCDGLCFRS